MCVSSLDASSTTVTTTRRCVHSLFNTVFFLLFFIFSFLAFPAVLALYHHCRYAYISPFVKTTRLRTNARRARGSPLRVRFTSHRFRFLTPARAVMRVSFSVFRSGSLRRPDMFLLLRLSFDLFLSLSRRSLFLARTRGRRALPNMFLSHSFSLAHKRSFLPLALALESSRVESSRRLVDEAATRAREISLLH